MDVDNRGADADRASTAFKAVAQVGLEAIRQETPLLCILMLTSPSQVYIETRSGLAFCAGAISFSDVIYLGGLWYVSGNLAAPVVAALAANWVDFNYLHQVSDFVRAS